MEPSDPSEHKKVLSELGLTQYFPEKITLQTVMTKYSGKLDTLKDVPWYCLSKLLMLDYRARDDFLPESLTGIVNNDSNDPLDDILALIEDKPEQGLRHSGPHPLDVVIVIFQCSSNCLRQILCEKMFLCKLSIPLVLPRFMNQQSMLLLWSLRNIILEYKDTRGEFTSTSVVSTKAPIISCLRLGNVSRSKSKFLNEILNSQSHNTFFHKDCKNGMMNQKLSKGLIEIALYMPSTNESSKDDFSKVVMFTNLRGDGLVHCEGSEFLRKVSNVILVMVDVGDFGKPDVIFSLESIASSEADTILMLTKNFTSNFDAACKDNIKSCTSKMEKKGFKTSNIVFDFTSTGERNIKELRDDVFRKINAFLKEKSHITTLESHEALIEKMSMKTDENMPTLITSKQIALKLVQEVNKDNVGINKRQKLPLQGEVWHDWARLSKEEHRLTKKKPNESSSTYIANLHIQKMEKRKEQLEYLKKPHTFFETLLKSLKEFEINSRIYIIKWLKFYLDELSRKNLPGLQKDYGLMMNEISNNNKEETLTEQQEKLTKLAKDISDASFGIEHLMREICQAYEAVAQSNDNTIPNITTITDYLPKFMAELMLAGYPLEFMDGDASYVPTAWIKSVLKELAKLIGEEKKIFVLSVLGIQSSGKSTMLNTMFGLQFPVAAGRCTRGVFAQLVPLSEDHSNVKYDYMLIVDTEGLRAPELGQGYYQHDNEIATFVIGLGDVTLVNIKGENMSELEDILQIVVHAILKMRLVNKDLKLQPSCVFIHQNVGAVDADQKMKGGQQKFLETLDKVTIAAARQEDAPQFTRFNQVIDVDITKHIWYVSDLWKGDLPMAPANHGYSEKITLIKKKLLTDTMLQKYHPFTISQLCLRIEDLWKGILDQNFVFSFKNSITLQSYILLEVKLSDLIFSMADKALEWVNKNKNVIWTRESEMETLESKLLKDIDEHFRSIYLDEKKDLDLFFEENGEKQIFEQWKNESDLKLQNVNEHNIYTTKRRIKVEIEMRKAQLDHANYSLMYEEKIPNYVKSLAEDLKSDPRLSKSALRERFDKKWSEWMESFQTPFDKVDIYKSFLNAVHNSNIQDQPLILQSFEMVHRKRLRNNLTDCINKYVVENDTICNEQQFPQKSSGQHLSNPFFAQKIVALQKDIESEVHGNSLNETYANYLIRSVHEMVDELTTSGVTFTSLNKFKIYLSVYACQLASFQISNICKTEVQGFITSDALSNKINEIDVYPVFKEVLLQTFFMHTDAVNKALEENCTLTEGDIGDFDFDMKDHILQSQENDRFNIHELLKDMLSKIKSNVDETEIQPFREEYAERIIRNVDETIRNSERSMTNATFTKKFKIQMAIHACMYAIPRFYHKNKRYLDKIDPRIVYESKNKDSYFEMLKNLYDDCRNEMALANILAVKLCKAIEVKVDEDMPRVLAKEVRSHVHQIKNKSALLQAILKDMLDVNIFDEYFLYLQDINSCFDKWIKTYINNYIFQSTVSDRKTRYVVLASQQILSLISQVCKDVQNATENIPRINGKGDYHCWIKKFHESISKEFTLSEKELTYQTDDFRVNDLSVLTKSLKTEMEASHARLSKIFASHTETHLLSAHQDNVYNIISKECKGCTEMCPFCKAPCSRSIDSHINLKIDHSCVEHYPQGCGGMRWKNAQKLVTESCPVHIASDLNFKTAESNYEWHPYKKYKELYPEWHINGDPSVDASPYWKWFLVQFAEKLSDKYSALLPNIPEAWKTITIDKARNSLIIDSSSKHVIGHPYLVRSISNGSEADRSLYYDSESDRSLQNDLESDRSSFNDVESD